MTKSNVSAGSFELTRRSVLAAVPVVGAAAWLTGPAATAFAESSGTVLPLLPTITPPDRGLFAPEDVVFGRFLMTLAPLTNSIIDDDPDLYGWMPDGWWGGSGDPYRARIMEQVATLAWFYANERPWNPYSGSPQLLGRLDAALGYYLGLQNPSGSWPGDRDTPEHLATTAFGTRALSTTLSELKRVNALPSRCAEIETSLRAACDWLLDLNSPHWSEEIYFYNQNVAGLAGVAQTAEVLGDPSMTAQLSDRMDLLSAYAVSEAGYTHENLGYDWGYAHIVALPDVADVYIALGLQESINVARKLADWMSYVVLWEPDNQSAFHYSGLIGRGNNVTWFSPGYAIERDRPALGRLFIDEVPELAMYHRSAEAMQEAYDAWYTSSAPLAALPKGDIGMSPRLWMHVPHAPIGATQAEREVLLADVPYRRSTRFTEWRAGTRPDETLFVRRPGYYIGSAYGEKILARQVLDSGVLWHPEHGTLILTINTLRLPTSTGTEGLADNWAVRSGQWSSARDGLLTVTYHEGADASAPVINREDLAGATGEFTTVVTYQDGSATLATTYADDHLIRRITNAGTASEQIPFVLAADDEIVFSDGTIIASGSSGTATASSFEIHRDGDVILTVAWETEQEVSISATSTSFLSGNSRRQHIAQISFTDELAVTYTLPDTGAVIEDDADDVPGQAAIATTSGHAHGLHDGFFKVNVDKWWGQPASSVRLFENDVLIGTVALDPSVGLAAQRATFEISGRTNGTYTYRAELINSKGVTQTRTINVTVKDAAPSRAALSHNNWSRSSAYTVTASLWWGTNASAYRLYENGVLVDEKSLTANTPNAQIISTAISGQSAGNYTYVAELENHAGVTQTQSVNVIVS